MSKHQTREAIIRRPHKLFHCVANTRLADYILEMRDISVDESEELPQILHPLVNDGPPALAGRNAQVRQRVPQRLLPFFNRLSAS